MPHAPLIIDTDAVTDPDDAVALVVAARADPELPLVLTYDELGGESELGSSCICRTGAVARHRAQ